MSAEHRSLARLPLSIFTNLTDSTPFNGGADEDGANGHSMDYENPERLRSLICAKMLSFAGSPQQSTKVAGPGTGEANFYTVSSLDSCGISTVGQFLLLSMPTILRVLSSVLNAAECDELVRRICIKCSAPRVSALAILRQTVPAVSIGNMAACGDQTMRHLPSGMPSLDECLGGGFRIGTITELVGRAGVGKTQFALQLCVTAARYGQGGIYVDTEQKLSLRRLEEMAHERFMTTGDGSEDYAQVTKRRRADRHIQCEAFMEAKGQPSYRSAREVLENLTVHSVLTTEEMFEAILGLEDEILFRNEEAEQTASDGTKTKFPVRLVVLDSIASPAKRDFGPDTAHQRVVTVFKTAQVLKRMADQLRLAVVVVNQVGRVDDSSGVCVDADGSGADMVQGSDFVAVSAALGPSWHHCVTTRLLLEHERDPHRERNDIDAAHEAALVQFGATASRVFGNNHGQTTSMTGPGCVRSATVLKSNVAGRTRINFEVTAVGLCEIGRHLENEKMCF